MYTGNRHPTWNCTLQLPQTHCTMQCSNSILYSKLSSKTWLSQQCRAEVPPVTMRSGVSTLSHLHLTSHNRASIFCLCVPQGTGCHGSHEPSLTLIRPFTTYVASSTRTIYPTRTLTHLKGQMKRAVLMPERVRANCVWKKHFDPTQVMLGHT